MKRKFSTRIGAITDRLQDIWSELMDEEAEPGFYIVTDCIESAIGELEEASAKLARSGR